MNYIDTILFNICCKLQLSDTLYKSATERYEAVASILGDAPFFKNTKIELYAQGSFRLKTTVKPLNRDEYDLDFVAQISAESNLSPWDIYYGIYNILKHDGIHNGMVELKKRCIRINYANDFHLDIMPGKLIGNISSEIKVPDKENQTIYHHSNPKAYSEWFEKQAREVIVREMKSKFYADSDIEHIQSQQDVSYLEPLRRAVQLVKRYRDIYCDTYDKEPVRSIVLCTLMGQLPSYWGDAFYILKTFCKYTNALIDKNGNKPFDIINPVVDENLTEKWYEGNNFQDFVDMMKNLERDLEALSSFEINSDINKLLKKMFGETVTQEAICAYADDITSLRNEGKLKVGRNGRLSESEGELIRKNTFYGE